MNEKAAFLRQLLPIEETITACKKPRDWSDEEHFRRQYVDLLRHLEELARQDSPSGWDQPGQNYEYIFAEISYCFSEISEFFVNVDDIDDMEMPLFRNRISENQAGLLIRLNKLIDDYKYENLHAIQEEVGAKVFKKINKHYRARNRKSIFPYFGVNKIVSLDPEWGKIRSLAQLTWESFVSAGLRLGTE
ncbi:MAG: hypothetical protein KDK64_04395 [Chlamydiia bacterium]|nr:hypothetical protein [Chlamydiia bacterium]